MSSSSVECVEFVDEVRTSPQEGHSSIQLVGCVCVCIYIYIKVKCSRYRPGVGQRVGRGTRRG